MSAPRTTVPCNGCRACCLHDLILLHPERGDRPGDYQTFETTNPLTGKAAHALKRNAHNNCIYLGERGCTIHDRAPVVCREFDCRAVFRKWTRAERRHLIAKGLIGREVFEAGRKRLGSLGGA